MSGIIFGGATIDLTAPPTNIGTTTPPGITVSTLFRSANTGNAAFVAQPSGTGAFQLQQADNTATGGNARGDYAIDLQILRSAASQVASGSYSTAIGTLNTASGQDSFTIGYLSQASGAFSRVFGAESTATGSYSNAIGNYNTASGSYSTAIGNYNTASGFSSLAMGGSTASGIYSVAIGGRSSTKNVGFLFAFGTDLYGVAAKNQATLLNIGTQTTNATPTALRSDTSAAAATNQLVLQNNSSIAFFGLATATVTGGGDTACWKVEGGIKRGANAASTALVGTPSVTSIGANAGASGWALALTADTTNGCLAATVTNGNGVTVRVNLSLFASEVAF